MKIRIAAFADEAGEKFTDQISALVAEKIPYIELRSLDGKNISEITAEEAVRYAKMLDTAGIKVWAIGSPLGKIGIDDDFDAHLEKAEHVFKLAEVFSVSRVRMFSFYTEDPDSCTEKVIERLNKLVSLASRYGVTLCHENEKGIFGDTAARCDLLLKRVEGLKCVFDPANFVQCGQDVGEALDILADRVDYYHIKDAKKIDGAVVPAGRGDGELYRLIAGIARDVTLTVEPHLSVFSGLSYFDKTELKNEYVYGSQREAFSAAIAATDELLEKNSFHFSDGTWIK